LREEGSGILRWGLMGFLKLQAEMRDRGDFVLTQSQQERIKEGISLMQRWRHYE
jgi:hypothetical protein